MGLDCVEIVLEVEDEFGIKIPDDEASRIQHVGELVQSVLNKCARMPQRRCASAHSFYRLRSALMNLTGVARRDVRPASELAVLIPVETRSRAWQQLGDLGLRLPALQRPEALVGVAVLVVLVTFVVTIAAAISLGAPTAALLAILCCAVATFSAHRLTNPWATSIPHSCARVADAVHYTLDVAAAHLSRGEISYKVRLLIAEQLGLPLDTVTEDKHFVNDLDVD